MSLSRILANIGTALDSATTGDFLSKVDSDGVFGSVAYSSVTGTPTVLDSANVTNLVDSAYVQLRQSAVSGGGLDSATTISLVDSDYITSRATASGFQMFEYDATAGQTEFTGSDVNGNTLAYSEYGLLVHYNGILLSGATDYTATDGTTVVLTDSADEGARITIAKWSLASAGGGGSAGIAWGGDRGVRTGGNIGGRQTTIDYFDITTPSNATDFGDLTEDMAYHSACSNSVKCLSGGGVTSAPSNLYTSAHVDVFTISTTGNATVHGNLSAYIDDTTAFSNGTNAFFAGGYSGGTNVNFIQQMIFDTTGNASDFGDLTSQKQQCGSVSDGTYGVIAGGNKQGVGVVNDIDYVAMASSSNASDFGDLTSVGLKTMGASDTTRGVFMGGSTSGSTSGHFNTIQYVTIATPSNATDFGDLLIVQYSGAACGNDTRAVHMGGQNNAYPWESNVIQYVTIQTTGNATDFGDLTQTIEHPAGASGSPS